MRTSAGSLALITRSHLGTTQFLLQYNPGWKSFHLVGGHCRSTETFVECAHREIMEELNLQQARDYELITAPIAQLRYQAYSERAREETAYEHFLYDVILTPEAQEQVSQRPENIWVTLDEISQGQTASGQSISPTANYLFSKTGRLTSILDPSVYTVGVTGHRTWKLPTLEMVRRKVQWQLDHAELLAKGKPITILSSLATGADQLVAEIGLARGYRLIAALPLPVEIYMQDFAELEKFRHLLEHAAEWFSLPLPDGISRQSLNDNKEHRDQAYLRAGQHIVDRSHFLLAIWDGVHHPQNVGTSGTMQYILQRQTHSDDPFRIGIVNVER